MIRESSWRYCGIQVSPKRKIIGFAKKGTFENPEITKARVWGFSHKQIESYKTKMKQNNSLQFLSISFHKKYHKNSPTITSDVPICSPWFSYDFLMISSFVCWNPQHVGTSSNWFEWVSRTTVTIQFGHAKLQKCQGIFLCNLAWRSNFLEWTTLEQKESYLVGAIKQISKLFQGAIYYWMDDMKAKGTDQCMGSRPWGKNNSE